MADMPTEFWGGWIVAITVTTFFALLWFVIDVYRSGDEPHALDVWDETLREGAKPAPIWWFWYILALMTVSVIYVMLYPGLGTWRGALGWSQGGLFWGIDLYAVGENADITTRTIITSPQDKLLAAQVPLTFPPISKLEYAILWTCLAILLSALAVIPVVLWRVKSSGWTTQLARRWTKVAAWAAWFNSLLCALLTFVLMIIIDLETIVLQPIAITSTSGMRGRIFTGVSYVCILLTIFQIIFTILAWEGKRRSLVERLYYSLVTLVAADYLLLLGRLGLIAVW